MKAPEPLQPQEAIQHQREKDRFAPLNAILDQLEPASSMHISMSADRFALSSAISLRRIADALEPTIVTGKPSLDMSDVDALLGTIKGTAVDEEVESLAGNYLNFTADEITGAGSTTAERLAGEIRRLASAVLRKANK